MDCPLEPHVHFYSPAFLPVAWVVHVDHQAVAACVSRAVAERLAVLLDEHGVVDVPDHLPADLMWGPPVTDRVTDPVLPVDPTLAERSDDQPRVKRPYTKPTITDLGPATDVEQ